VSAAFCNGRWSGDPNAVQFGGLDLADALRSSKKMMFIFGSLPKPLALLFFAPFCGFCTAQVLVIALRGHPASG